MMLLVQYVNLGDIFIKDIRLPEVLKDDLIISAQRGDLQFMYGL